LIRCTLESQHKKDFVGQINHDRVKSPSAQNDLVVGLRFIPLKLFVILLLCIIVTFVCGISASLAVEVPESVTESMTNK